MKVFSIVLSDAPVARTVDNHDGFLLDLDEEGNVLALEVYDVRHAKVSERSP